MTQGERIEMFKNKKAFIDRLVSALTNPPPQGANLIDIRYEVYTTVPENDSKTRYFEEFIILVFNSAECPVCANGNSDSANLRVIANHINGGSYADLRFYEQIKAKMQKII